MIKSITIENFKCIRHLELDLAPLTILVGPNGSGKSSILDAIELMRLGALKHSNPIKESTNPQLRDESNYIFFEEEKDLFLLGDEGKPISLGFSMDVDLKEVKAEIKKDYENEHFKNLPRYREFLKKLLMKNGNVEVSYLFSYRSSYFKHQYRIDREVFEFEQLQSERRSIPPELELSPAGTSMTAFLPSLIVKGYESTFFRKVSQILKEKLGRVYRLTAERGSIPWSCETKYKPSWVGRRGEHLLEIFSTLMMPSYNEKRFPYELLCKEFGILRGWAGWKEGNVLTSNYIDPKLGSSHKFPSLGYGSRQLLSVIAQLAFSEPGSMILVDEPEMSLHPCLLYTSPSPRDLSTSRMPSSA